MRTVGRGSSRALPEPNALRCRRLGEGLAALAAVLVACSGSGSGSGPGGGPDTTAPTVPSNVAAKAVSATRIDVTWLVSSDDVGVTGYRVRRDGAVVGTADAAAFVNQGLSPGSLHCYSVSAYDVAGNESTPSAPVCATTLADTTAPTVPSNVAAAAVSVTRIDVTWLASSDDVGVTGYRVRRDGGVVGTAAAAPFVDLGLSPNTLGCYTVSAYDAAGNESTPSAPACATTLADTTPPGAPEGVLAQAVSPARIALAWNPASDDVGVTGYRVRRGGVTVATAGSSTWEDPTRQPQTAYCYTVSALDAAGNESAPSGPACATTPRRPVPASGHLEMALTDGGDGTVADAVTGLVWQQASPGPYNWYEATGTLDASLNPSGTDPCGALALGGHTGWRLPTDAELLDIAAYDLSPAIDTTLFPAPEDFYWASTPLDPGTARIWFSGLGWLGVGARNTAYAARCVLGGPGLGPRLTVPGDGTVVDDSTGLIWQQGDGGVRPHDGPSGATAYCAALALGGSTFWRLPTIKEARSLAPIDLAAFPGTAAEQFWSSTCGVVGCWWVNPVGGQVNADLSGTSLWTRCVRGPSAPAGTTTEFAVPTVDGRPWGIAEGPDGNLWFTEWNAGRIGRITPTGAVTEFALPAGSLLPHGITTGPDGNVWFTVAGGSKIGRITPGGTLTEFTGLTASPFVITAGPDGRLWFTEMGSKIGAITTTGTVAEFTLPTPNCSPAGIAVGPDGNLWFAEQAGNKIGRITTTGAVTEFSLPNLDSYPTGIAAGPDGNLWFTESHGHRIGRITLDGVITEFDLPSSASASFIAAGPDGNLWFSETCAIGRITPGGTITEFPLASCPRPLGITVGPDGNVWFAEELTGIGRIVP